MSATDLLVLLHSRTGSTAELSEAVCAGARTASVEVAGGGSVPGDGAGVGGGHQAAASGGHGDGVAGGGSKAEAGPGAGGAGPTELPVPGSGGGLQVRQLDVADAGLDDVLAAAGVVFCTPARFGALAGLTKDLLERIYPWFEGVPDVRPGLPWTAVVKGATDPSGAVRDLERILTGLRWKQVLPPLQVVGDVAEPDLSAAWDLGATMAAGLATHIW